MTEPIDRESYVKGCEDAMRMIPAQEVAPAPAPPEPPYGIPPDAPAPESTFMRKAPSRARLIGDWAGTAFATALGWLVLFPLGIGLMVGCIAWVLSDGAEFQTPAVAAAGLMFLFAVFAGAFIVGWKVFINFWPIVLVVVGIVIAVKALT